MYFTHKQIRILNFLRDEITRTGQAPTLAEIARHFRVSTSTIHEHIQALERKKAIRHAPHRPRSIELITAPLPKAGLSASMPRLAGHVTIAPDTDPTVRGLGPVANRNGPFDILVDRLEPVHILFSDARQARLTLDPNTPSRSGDLVLALLDSKRLLLARFDLPAPGPGTLRPLTGLPPLPPYRQFRILAVAIQVRLQFR